MGTSIAQRECKPCEGKTAHTIKSPSHLIHIILAIVTAGFWLLIYIPILIFSGKKATCNICGKNNTGVSDTSSLVQWAIILLFFIGIHATGLTSLAKHLGWSFPYDTAYSIVEFTGFKLPNTINKEITDFFGNIFE